MIQMDFSENRGFGKIKSGDGDEANQISVSSHTQSPEIIRPQAQRPAFLRDESLVSINSSLSFLIREAAHLEEERKKAKTRQSQRPKSRLNISTSSPMERISSTPHSNAQSIENEMDQNLRARSPWFAKDAINAANEAQLSMQQVLVKPIAERSTGVNRSNARSVPPRDTFTPKSPFDRPETPGWRSHTPFLRHYKQEIGRSTTPAPEQRTADLIAQMEAMIDQDDQQDAEILNRVRKTSSARTPIPTFDRSTTEDEVDDDVENHMLLKGDDEDAEVLEKVRSRTSTASTANTSQKSKSIPQMTEEEKLEAIVDEFGPAPELHPQQGQIGPERIIASQGAVLVRRVLVRGYLLLTTHRLCFIALLPNNPRKNKRILQGPAIVHRPGLTRRKRKAWFTLSHENITAYRNSTEMYEPLGGVRLADIDDVQSSPIDKSVHFRVKGKKVSLEFETEEAAMTWQREIDAAMFLMTHNMDKIRICIPLVRIAHAFLNDYLDIATVIHFDVLETDLPQYRHPRFHHHSDRNPHSTKDVLFSILKAHDANREKGFISNLQPQLDIAANIRAKLDPNLWFTLPGALIDIDGPRSNHGSKDDGKETSHEKVDVFIEQFSLDCSPEEIKLFKVHLLRTLPLAGTLAITPKHICFYRTHRWTGLADTRIRIPFLDIKLAEPGKAFLWHHHGIKVHIQAHEDILFELRDESQRDLLVQLISDAAKQCNQENFDQESVRNLDNYLPQKNKSTKSDILAMQENIKKIELSPKHINMVPRAINYSRDYHLTIASMKVYCVTIGSRGDVQPYIALCKRLQKDKHDCTIVSHEEYREWVEKNGFKFRAIGGDPGELMKLSVDNNKMLFSPQFYREAMSKFRHWLDELLRGIMEECWDADLIIESPSTFGGIHVAEAVNCYYMRAFTMPWTRTSTYPQAFSVPGVDLGPQYNAMSYTLFDQVLWLASSGQVNRWRKHMLHLEPTDLTKLDQSSVPFMYNFSPAVVPPPLDWGDRIKVTGYWILSNDANKWSAPKDLLEFIDQAKRDNKKLCYIGFGSITMPDPLGVQKSIYEAVQRSDVRAIVSKGWSGRQIEKIKDGQEVTVEPPKPPNEVYVVDSIPHDWLFPKIDIAMHHGGAGTTGASLRAGLITLIHPFFGDQYFWSGRVAKLGAGLRVKSLQTDDIAEALSKARDERLLREKAQTAGESIRREDGLTEAVQFIYHNLNKAKRIRRPLGVNSARRYSSNAITPFKEHENNLNHLPIDIENTTKRDAPGSPVLAIESDLKQNGRNSIDNGRRFSLNSIWKSSSSMKRGGSLKASLFKRNNDGSGSSKEESKPARSSTFHAAINGKVDEIPRRTSPTMMSPEEESSNNNQISPSQETPLQQDENRKSWLRDSMSLMPHMNTLSMPSLSMPHMNFFDARLHGIHLPHKNHSEAAALAKEKMTEEEKEHARNEEKEFHLSARQEDQRRRQLLENTWRKAKRFDLLGAEAQLNIQPEEDETSESESNNDESQNEQNDATSGDDHNEMKSIRKA